MIDSKFTKDFDGAYLVATLNPQNKTWEQQLNQIFQILDNCHINIKSKYMRDLTESWFIARLKKSCPGYWNIGSHNYEYETQFEKLWNR